MTMNSRGMIVFTAAVLILSALLVKAVAPRQTAAGTDAANGEVQASVPVYDLHIHHPHMKELMGVIQQPHRIQVVLDSLRTS